MNKTIVLGFIFLGILLLTGCVQKTENNTEGVKQTIANNQEIVSDQNKTVVEVRYVCPDGSTVTDASKCPETKEEIEKSLTNCADGTLKLSCSIAKPYFCTENLDLIERATRCGCPVNMDPLQDSCLSRCTDGTREGLCSITKPKQCVDTQLIDNPGKCGCPEGYQLNTTAQNCQIHIKTEEEIWLENSRALSRILTLEYFSLVIKRAGYYEIDEKVYIRLDIKLTNKDNEPQDFFTSDMALVDSAKYQYDSTDEGTFNGGQFYPGVRREGSVLFEMGDRKPNVVTLMVNDGYDGNFEKVVKSTVIDVG